MSSAMTQTRPLHVADDVHHLGRTVLAAALVDDRQLRVQPLRVRARALGAAGVGRDDRHRAEVLPRQIIDDDGRREQVVHRNVKEPLNLRLVQIHREHAIRSRRAQQIRHELGRDRDARLVLAVLPRVAVIRQHRRDPRRRRSTERVDHHAELDQVLVHRRRRRLHDEDIGATDVLVDLKRDLRVREAMQPRRSERQRQMLGDLPRERRMRGPGEDLQLTVTHNDRRIKNRSRPAGANAVWLGRKDSNLRIRDPKSRALPLGHAPV